MSIVFGSPTYKLCLVHDSVYCIHIVVILISVYCVCISFSKVVLEEFLCNSSMGYTTRIWHHSI